jgi:hypothetical protein
MNLKKMLLMVALGLTASALSSYATQVNVYDVLNLTGQLTPIPGLGAQLISNSGGGNQHGQAQDPLFAFNGDLPRIIFQRMQFSSQPSDYSYLAIYQGQVLQNQPPPTGSTILNGSTAVGPNPPDFLIDLGAPSPSNAPQNAASQILAMLQSAPEAIYTIAVVEVNVTGNGNNQKLNTRGSIQFQFPNANVINGQLVPVFNITTQLGNR